jgi:S-formylglutathione hydrolase FrmB
MVLQHVAVRLMRHLDDWGPKGGHDWPYWHRQMWTYIGAHAEL